MPTYQYTCNKCKRTGDVFHKMSDSMEGAVCVLKENCKGTLSLDIVAPSIAKSTEEKAVLADKFYGKKAEVPINIIDTENKKVTTIYKNKDPDIL